MASDGDKKAYLRGYEEGLRDAWEEFIRMTTRGHNISEVRLIAKSWLTDIESRVEAKRRTYVEEPERQVPAPRGREPTLKPGESCLFKETSPEGGLSTFSSLSQDGKGICIMRRHPETVRERLPMGELALLWLTRSEEEEAGVAHISPTNLVKLTSTILRLMEGDARPVVYLDAVEYLSSQNGFDQVLKFIQKVNEEVVLRRGNFLVSLSPEALEARQVQLIARELGREA